ncbi:MAG: GNAT family N-acetyltransferase [Clostridium sp.]|nr:GNAT family N-acetyltransferase [Clostridium sp.]
MCLYLRKVDQADVDVLYQWANDPAVRKMAFHTDFIPYKDHVEYFSKLLTDRSVYQYIMYKKGVPIGQIRLNITGNEALIDYSVSAENRGKGYGSELLRLIQKQIDIDKIPHVKKLIGQVKYENTVSAKVFEKCGFSKKEMKEYVQYEHHL